MPYKKISELPEKIKNHLPVHAQEIYQASFNNAWEHYKSSAKRATRETREEVAHKVAWTAVKKKYHKVGDHWVEN